MSLSSELRNPTPLRAALRRFPKPALPGDRPALVLPARSPRRSYIGTAYDYLLRFSLARAFPQAITRDWVADSALERIQEYGEQGVLFPFKGRYRASGEIARHIDRLLGDTRAELAQWQEGPASPRLARLALRVGQCDYLVRCFSAPRDFGIVYAADVRELCALIAATDLTLFSATQESWLNPHFGCGSYALGGADCDLIVDRRLIEIKTSGKRVFPTLSWHQLLGYAALSRVCPLNGADTIVPVDEIGVYFARYNELVVWKLADVVDASQFEGFLTWFRSYLSAWEEHRTRREAERARFEAEYEKRQERRWRAKEKSHRAEKTPRPGGRRSSPGAR